MFYIFSFVKGALMAMITLLIGAGWNVLKPFLSDREKKILLIALVLQLLTNTAIVMTDELAPGSISFVAWADVLHIAGEKKNVEHKGKVDRQVQKKRFAAALRLCLYL